LIVSWVLLGLITFGLNVDLIRAICG